MPDRPKRLLTAAAAEVTSPHLSGNRPLETVQRLPENLQEILLQVGNLPACNAGWEWIGDSVDRWESRTSHKPVRITFSRFQLNARDCLTSNSAESAHVLKDIMNFVFVVTLKEQSSVRAGFYLIERNMYDFVMETIHCRVSEGIPCGVCRAREVLKV
jgi:hypothetical protein